MKRFYTCVLLIATIAMSCQKNNSTSNSITVPQNPSVVVKPPTAGFKISNIASTGTVWEALPMTFENTSENGDSYFWDFGNGTTSTDKIPSNFSLVPCGFTYTITLKVTNSAGQSVTYSAPYYVLCSRGMGFGAHGDKH